MNLPLSTKLNETLSLDVAGNYGVASGVLASIATAQAAAVAANTAAGAAQTTATAAGLAVVANDTVIADHAARIAAVENGSSLWPSSGHVDNVEFMGTEDAWPTGWSVWRDNASGVDTLAAAAYAPATNMPVAGIDAMTAIAVSTFDASKVRFNCNSPRRPGWLFVQSPSQAGANRRTFLYAKQMASNMPSDFVAIARFMMHDHPSTTENGSGQLYWMLLADSSNTPAGVTSGGKHMSFGISPESGGLTVYFSCGSSAVSRVYSANASVHSLGSYMKIQRKSGNVHAYIGTPGGAWTRIGAVANASGQTNGVLRWWAFTSFNRNDGGDLNPDYVGFNWMRRYDQAVDLL